MPWSTALRTRWVSGSLTASSRLRSSSVSLPSMTSWTCLPSEPDRSRTTRGSFDQMWSIGCIRVFMIPSCSSLVIMPSRWATADQRRVAGLHHAADQLVAGQHQLADQVQQAVQQVDVDPDRAVRDAALRAPGPAAPRRPRPAGPCPRRAGSCRACVRRPRAAAAARSRHRRAWRRRTRPASRRAGGAGRRPVPARGGSPRPAAPAPRRPPAPGRPPARGGSAFICACTAVIRASTSTSPSVPCCSIAASRDRTPSIGGEQGGDRLRA